MPAKPPYIAEATAAQLKSLGESIRNRRKALDISAATLAEAANMSRPTVHRIEQGASSVTIGAWLGAMEALGLSLTTILTSELKVAEEAPLTIPVRIRLLDYPVLQQLAWQLHENEFLSPQEALDIYERNWRHLEAASLSPGESNLIKCLQLALSSTGKTHKGSESV